MVRLGAKVKLDKLSAEAAAMGSENVTTTVVKSFATAATIDGGIVSRMTVSRAPLLCAVLKRLAAARLYTPSLKPWTLGSRRIRFVAPASIWPSLYHWKEKGGVPKISASKIADCPSFTVWLTGEVAILTSSEFFALACNDIPKT